MSAPKRWFSYDPTGDGFVLHETLQAARQAAHDALTEERAAATLVCGGTGLCDERFPMHEQVEQLEQANVGHALRVQSLVAALKEALDMLGPCDRSEEERGRCTHRDGLHRLPCPVEEMRKLLEED